MTNQEEPKNPIQESVLAAIEAGRVKMRPRWQFILRAGLFTVGVILAALAVLFIGSFIVFMLQQNGAWFAPALGGPGLKDLFFALPIIFIVVAAIFLVLLQVLMRHYSFSYHRPVIYSVVGITIFVIVGSLLVAQTHIHEGLFLEARDQKLPIIGGFYRQFGTPEVDNITAGRIIEKTPTGFNMNDPHDQFFTVLIAPDTKLIAEDDLEAGDYVIVLGDRLGEIIAADGIREIEPRETIFQKRREY